MDFRFGVPAYVQFGDNSSKQVGPLLTALGAKKVFCIYDKGVKNAGLVDGLVELIKKAGITVIEYDGVLANPPSEVVEAAAEIGKREKVDALVAIGGGSAMDCAKAVNILLTNPSPIFQYAGPNQVKNPVKPLIAIPTTAGTSSEVTAVTVISDTQKKKKIVILGQHVGATHALIDPLLTMDLPPSITAATGMDALTHAIESYTSVNVSPATEVHSLKAIELIAANLAEAVKNGHNTEARTNMMLACLHAGIAFGNADLGLVHTIAHPLSARCGLAHGDANAAMLPYVVAYNADAVPERTREIARALGVDVAGKSDEEAATLAVDKIKELSAKIGIKTLRGLNVPETALNDLVEDSMLEATLQFNPKQPKKEDVRKLLELAY
ncbi:MAG: iron-containing alcohol dehydrogenase [Desulfopila sp.]